jgi:hypothetical protein
MNPDPAPPAWVCKRDGRLVPFEADKISRALFAASEGLGRPDAFLAREMTDAIVHFLAHEYENTLTTQQVAEEVVKFLGVLGQPALAEAFAQFGRQRIRNEAPPTVVEQPEKPVPAAAVRRAGDRSEELVFRFAPETPPADVIRGCVRGYTLQTVFARDLVAAQGDGLLTLTGLQHPGELAGCLLGPPHPKGDWIAALEEVRRFAGRFVVLDGPEYLLAASGQVTEAAVRSFVHELLLGLRITGLQAIVNLHAAEPPSWADDLAEGPLFASQQKGPRSEQLALLADALARELLRVDARGEHVRIDWHLGEGDLDPDSPGDNRLLDRVHSALEGIPLAFVFDRPRHTVSLAEGIDRQHPAVLLTVGLHLPRLAEKEAPGDAALFLQKLGSLARLALSAGVQKREFLRRQDRTRSTPTGEVPAVTSGFLLDRARLVVAPVGLDHVVAVFTQRGLCSGGAGLEFGRKIAQRLRDVLRQDGRTSHLETCLDGPFDFHLDDSLAPQEDAPAEQVAGLTPKHQTPNTKHQTPEDAPAEQVAGLTPWAAAAPVKNQLRVGGALHGLADHGTLALFVPGERPPVAEEVVQWLRTAWHQTEVVRLRLVRAGSSHRQLTFSPLTSAAQPRP